MVAVSMQVKQWFFDRQRILRAADRATIRSLSKAGAFIRRRAMYDVLRRRKRASQPGHPPSVHSRDKVATLRNILFAFEAARRSVIVGPVKLNTVFWNGDGKPATGTVPSVLEFGGTIGILQWYLGPPINDWRRADLRSKRRLQFRRKRMHKVTIAARPFMSVALERERHTFPSLFANSIKAA